MKTQEEIVFEILENLPPMKGDHIGKTMLHELSQCNGGQWRVIFCSDFGYAGPVYGETALGAIQLAIKVLCEEK